MRAKIRTLGADKARRLARALLRRTPDLRCLVCREADFARLEDLHAGVRSRLEQKTENVALHQEATTLFYTHCGQVMQFADVVFKSGTSTDAFRPVTNE